MTDTANLGLPFIEGSQAQKHVTHNEALRILDAAIQIAVLDLTRTAPPASPVDGARYIVASAPTGAWTGHAKAIATWQDGAWAFLAPKTGWCVWSVADAVLFVFDGATWRDQRSLPVSLDNAAHIGVNTAATSPNLLSVKSNAALLAAINTADDGSGDVRLQLSKESAAKTASVVFSDAYSGRAEFGLAGDDDIRLKVSANGTTWTDALRIDRASGRVTFPVTGGPRELLGANRIYYVRTDGNDGNNGLSNTSGGAFLTLQKAIDTAAALDIGIYSVTIQLADGTYAGANTLKNVVGFAAPGNLVIRGNATTPANVVIAATSADALSANGLFTVWDIRDLKVTTTTSGNGIAAKGGATVRFGNINFGSCANAQLYVDGGASLVCLSDYVISGSASYHWQAVNGGSILAASGFTVTLTGTPAFTAAFAYVGLLALVNCWGNTFSGAATGVRYNVFANSAIFTNAAGATYLPGNAAGTASSGGQYV